jgi:pyrroloquinoline quinone biosynthesis protein B
VEAVVLTDGELDHVTGLLSLREQKELRLACTPAIRALLTKQFPILPALRRYCRIRHTTFPTQISGLRFSSMDVCEKAPLYADHVTKRGGVVGLRIEDVRRRTALAYLPCLTAITEKVRKFVHGCDCLLVDGTFWSNDEMTSLGLTKRSARDMGHVPITGSDGSLSWLRELDVPRKVYIHINNTNPILRRGSPERKAVERAGIEVGYDGMDIRI